MAIGSYARISLHLAQFSLRLLLASLSLLSLTDSLYAQQNVTLDDTDLYIMYAPATSWHASTVECDTCLAPPSSFARGGTWHDGTHVIPTVDEDDEGSVGDSDGDGTTSVSSTVASSPGVQTFSTSSAQPAQTNTNTNVIDGNDEDENDGHRGKGGEGKGGDGRRRLRRFDRSEKRKRLTIESPLSKRDGENPFEVQGNDADDPEFQDIPVTATLNFTGQAVYVFAIIPLFPAPLNTTPTFTNLSFTLDGTPHGSFTYRPDAAALGTPTVNSSDSEKFQPNVNVFSVSGLADAGHSLVVNVGVDSVFLLDYIIYTAGANDPTISGSITTPALDSEQTASSTSNSNETNKHNIATFAGAVGGSFGLLSAVAVGLCISIRCRRRRARIRENARRNAFAQNFTARDHGEDGPEDEDGANGPVMAQANPAPFVPRYFPNSLPASPPPYASGGDRVIAASPVAASIDRADFPIAESSTLPPMITLPTATLDLQRTISNNSSNSYADRPPPTPPDEDGRILLFGTSGVREDRNLNGGVIGPLPIDSPSNESDPMLNAELQDVHGLEDRVPDQRMSLESICYRTFGTRRSSRSSASGESSGRGPSSILTPQAAPTSIAASILTRSETQPKGGSTTTSGTFSTLTDSTSLPSFSTGSPSQLLSSPSYPDLTSKPASSDGQSSFVYRLLRPPRVPLPPSMYGPDVSSQESLERHDSRT